MEALLNISILSWNIRGAQNNNTKRHLKELIRKYNPALMAVYETHVPFNRVSSFWTNTGYTPIHIVEANGHSGGIWLLKQSASNITTNVIDSNPHSITFSISRGNANTTCTCIYASPNPTLRPSLWNHLTHINHTIDGPWMLIGDFNETLLPSDQRGGIFHHNRVAAFSNLMTTCNLLDLTTTGGRFTWHRNNNGIRTISKKLDRSIANVDWRMAFPEASVEVLCRLHSDHNPLLLRFGGLPLARGPRPFRFEAAWIDHHEYADLVKNSWHLPNITASLAKVQENSIIFNKEVFGNIFQRKKHIENRLKGVQNYLERVDSIRHSLLEKELQQEYSHILFQEEMLWYQKSREKWIKFGDKNTAFFHAQTIIRRKRNRIHRLQLPDGTWSSDSDTLQDEAQRYFKSFFTDNQPPHDRSFNEGAHPSIDADGKISLTSPITKPEVFAALNSMKPYKAPGPDGFHCIFFKQYWHIVGDDIFQMVQAAFQNGYFDPEISNTLIALIPKIDPPVTYKDFRPISLCNIIYKIITKVLVHRLRPILTNIIGPYQSSFLPGRGTSDNSIVLQELIHFMKRSKRKKGFVAFKLDLEKAFDNVNWDFLKQCLQDFGFPDITIKLIMHCVSSPSYSILWNGNKLPPFNPTHGLRQGDPLSPYLFILCMEKLSVAINSAVNQGRWEPIQITNTGPQLSHLLFADDVLLFTKAKRSQFHFIHNLFERFSRASGLKINISKSRAYYSSGTPQGKITNLTTISGIQSTTSIGKYLGFPMLHGRPKKSDFNFIIEKMQTRLASWKNRLLNRTGRLTLASSVLSSIPTYYMQINWLPQNICDSIDQTTRNFIWKGTNNKGIHLVNWKKVTSPKSIGGLGIKSARDSNTSLLGKLVWDMVQSTNKLWVNILSNKYTSGPNTLHATANTNSSPTWSSIIKAKDILRDGYVWRAGSGSSSFWFNHWTPHGLIGSLVPIIDIHDLQLTVRDVFTYEGQPNQAIYTTLPQPIAEFLNNTHINFNERVEDSFIWSENKNGVYSAKSGYSWILGISASETHNLPTVSWSWIWRLKIPEKFKLLVWLACHNAVPTLSLLHHRHIVASAICSRCGDEEETLLHCLRDCIHSKSIWIQSGFTDQTFFHESDAPSWIRSHATSDRATTYLACLWWSWRNRNQMCLSAESWSLTRIHIQIQNTVETIRTAMLSATTTRPDRMVRWNNNNYNCFVLNVDGSCLGSPIRAGFGGLIRNSSGFFLTGFSGFLATITDILFAELTAIQRGILLAIDAGIEDMVCYSDSMLSIQLLTTRTSTYHAYAVLIQDIKDLLSTRNFSIHHCLREGNQCADFLAKLGATSNEEFSTYDTAPNDLIPLIRNDEMGVLFPRA